MKWTDIKKVVTRKAILQTLIFIASALVLLYFFPGRETFRYHFQEGKPWKYELLTASFDFPIYKSAEELEQEQQSLQHHDYFAIDTTIVAQQLDLLATQYREARITDFPKSLYLIISSELAAIYEQGILPAEQYEVVMGDNNEAIKVLQGNTAHVYPDSLLLTTRSAYSRIAASIVSEYEKNCFRQLNINNYLKTNLTYDSIQTERIKSELITRIPLSTGMVQVGERIIDRGEIISHQTFLILKSMEAASEKRNSNLFVDTQATAIGRVIVVISLLVLLYLFLKIFRPAFFADIRTLLFISLLIVGVSVTAFLVSTMNSLAIYLVPFSILPIIIVTFLDSRVALYAHLVTVLLCAFVAPFTLEFIFLQVAVGMIAIDNLQELVKRSQLVQCAILSFLAYAITYTGYVLLVEGGWVHINGMMFLYFAISCLLLLFAYLLIYLLEKGFGFISNVTLVELSDINSPVLRQLSEECPGTFQHSLQVSNLAAEAANKIGASAQLVRTGALYHDIGKIANAAFFTENQSGVNPHNSLSYVDSAAVIIMHVRDGERLADKYLLPQAIKDFIITHHGASKTKYFYNSYRNEFPDKEVDESLFTYPGPLPFTKETALVMMADSVEAASRSLKEFTEESLTKLVESIINAQIADGQLKDAPISFRDVEVVKRVFIEKLKIIYHTRISYPELNVPSVASQKERSTVRKIFKG